MKNIFISAHSSKYKDDYLSLKKRVENEYPELRLRIIISEKKPLDEKLDEDLIFLLGEDYEIDKSNHSPEDTTRIIHSFSDYIPMDLFRSDLNFTLGSRSDDSLAYDQAYLSLKINEIFIKEPPDLVFASSGTNLIHSITYHLARMHKSKIFRVHSYLQSNIGFEGKRVWLCSNNEMKLSENKLDKYDYDRKEVNSYIETLMNSIATRNNKLDQLSINFKSRRMPINIIDLLKDIFMFFAYLISNDKEKRLKKNYHSNRLNSLFNNFISQFFITKLKDVKGNGILFLLNTPYDSQILVRSPQYTDFSSLISLISNLTPYGTEFLIREHPSFPGMITSRTFRKLLQKEKNIKLVSASEDLDKVLKHCKGVLIINNTAFIDAIINEKPVISIGNGYFKGKNLTIEVENLIELRDAFNKILSNRFLPNIETLKSVMIDQFYETYPGPGKKIDNKLEVITKAIYLRIRKIMDSQ